MKKVFENDSFVVSTDEKDNQRLWVAVKKGSPHRPQFSIKILAGETGAMLIEAGEAGTHFGSDPSVNGFLVSW